MADGNEAGEGAFALAGDGLRAVAWGSCDEPLGRFVASPADARGRGMALTVTRDGAAVDLTGASVYLLWRHRELRRRGCAAFEAADAAAGAFRVFWPAAMAAAEGTVDAQVMVSQGGEAISSLPFTVRVEQALAGGADAGEDSWSLFLEAIAKLEGAQALISDALASAQEAAALAEEALESAQGATGAAEAANAAADAANEAKDALLAAAERGDFDGAPGSAGAPGKDGVSPAASVSQTGEGAVLTVVDAAGTTSAMLLHGAKGDKGDPGPAGPAGADGRDGADADVVGASATVDASSGKPAVAVELGGTPGSRTLAFSFSGLKGEPGAQGEPGPAPDLSAYATKDYVAQQLAALEDLGQVEF